MIRFSNVLKKFNFKTIINKMMYNFKAIYRFIKI